MHLNVSEGDLSEVERLVGIWDEGVGPFEPHMWEVIAVLRRLADPRIRLESCLVPMERQHTIRAESCWCGGRRGGHFVKPASIGGKM